MKWLILLPLFYFSCTTPKISQKVIPPPDKCQQGSVLNCFEEGLKERDLKNNREAHTYFKKGCELNHPSSCTEQGLLERQMGNMKEYFRLQDKSCEGMDSVGCYNLACGYCVENDQAKTMEALIKASSLGYSNHEYAVKDPDLKCVYQNKEFLKWVSKLKKEKVSQFPISYDFSYLSGMDMALRFPPSFTITRSFPALFVHSDKAQISIYLSPDSYSTCLHKLDESILQKEGISDVQKVNTQRNGMKVRITKLKFIDKKKQLNEILYLTGSEKRCWIIDGVSSIDIEANLKKEIDLTVTSLVTKPFNQSSDDTFGIHLKTDKLKFAGVASASQGTGFFSYYSTDGIWHPRMKSTALYTGFFVSSKLEDDLLFKQRLGDMALKLIPYGYKFTEFVESYSKRIDGKLAIFYKSKARSNKEEILVTSVFYQKSETKLPVLLVHIQPKAKAEIIDWESALKGIVLK